MTDKLMPEEATKEKSAIAMAEYLESLADNPAAQGYVPVFPSTLRTAARLLLALPAGAEEEARLRIALRDLMRLYESKWSDEPPELVRARAILQSPTALNAPASVQNEPTEKLL